MIKKAISALTTVLVFYSCILTNTKLPDRELIILLENHNMESIDKTLSSSQDYRSFQMYPSGIGAMSCTYLIALSQEASPILISKTLIKNCIDHQRIFQDFINLNLNQLYNKYSKNRRFSSLSSIKKFKESCVYTNSKYLQVNNKLKNLKNRKNIKQILNKITLDNSFSEQFVPATIKSYGKYLAGNPIYYEMIIYLICNIISLEKNWIIKKVNPDVYLLIPKNYLKKINLDNSNYANQKSLKNNLTDLEINLGLKVNQLEDIKTIETEFYNNISFNKTEEQFTKVLEKVFVTKKDLSLNNKNNIKNNIWTIYAAGHGFPPCPQITLMPQLKSLEKFYSNKINKNKKFKNRYYNNYRFQEDHRNLAVIKQEIKKLRWQQKHLEPVHKGIIISLTKKEFQNLLKFFNNSVDTAFLYYTSCYAGGIHLIEPYFENKKPLILNYTVVSGTLAENMSLQESPIIKLPPYTRRINNNKKIIYQIKPKDINLSKYNLEISTTLQFNKFFNSLQSGMHKDNKNLPKIIFNLHPYTDSLNGKLVSHNIANIPSVRYANNNYFEIIPNDQSFLVIDQNIDKNSKNKSINLTKEAALLYTDYISEPIILDKNKLNFAPAIVSMLPGLSAHTFEEISSPNANFSEVIRSFMFFPELAASKIFWIKKLKCTNSPETRNLDRSKDLVLDDVIIMRNIYDTDISKNRYSFNRQVPTNTCVYLTPRNKKSYKITWDRPLDPYSQSCMSINNCNSDKHKHECVAFCPNIKSYIENKLENNKTTVV